MLLDKSLNGTLAYPFGRFDSPWGYSTTRRFHGKTAGFLLAERRPSHHNGIRAYPKADQTTPSTSELYGDVFVVLGSSGGLIAMSGTTGNGNIEEDNFGFQGGSAMAPVGGGCELTTTSASRVEGSRSCCTGVGPTGTAACHHPTFRPKLSKSNGAGGSLRDSGKNMVGPAKPTAGDHGKQTPTSGLFKGCRRAARLMKKSLLLCHF